MTYRVTPAALIAQLFAALLLGSMIWFGLAAPARTALELEVRASGLTLVKVSRSVDGRYGWSPSFAEVGAGDEWTRLRFKLGTARVDAIRVDLMTAADSSLDVRAVQLVAGDAARTTTNLLERARMSDGTSITTGQGVERSIAIAAGHPASVLLQVEPGDWSPDPPTPWALIATIGAACWAVLLAGSAALRSASMQSLLEFARRFPKAVVVLAAIVATCVSCWPVVFGGQSFVSPRNGFPSIETVIAHHALVTDSLDDDVEGIRQADVGALLLHHLPYSMQQARSLHRYGEFPLWNRFNAAGQSMPGQGQAMLGDPLNWIMWLTGVDAAAYDAKFIALRIVFASTLGLSVLMLTRSLSASMLLTVAATFIGAFVFRINHPTIFSLCWSPLVLLCWVQLADARPRRLALALASVVLANWLLINSGTVKEAYVSALVLNGIGVMYAGWSAMRETTARSLRLIAVSAAGPLAVLIGTPVWAPLLDAIFSSWSDYGKPVALQLPFYEVAGFADNFFFLVADGAYQPAVNALLFVGAAAAAFGLRFKVHQSDQSRFVSKVLTVTVAACLAIAFGLVPSDLLLSVPFLRSIHHVHNTFLTVAITPVCVLAGLGFAQGRSSAGSRSWRAGWAALATLAVLIALNIVLPPVHDPMIPILFAAALLMSTLVVLRWLARRDQVALRPAELGAMTIALLLILGRGAQWGDVSFDDYVFNPKARVDFVAEPPLVQTSKAAFTEPVRVVTAGAITFSGYHMALGLESIEGPEALQERQYRDLVEALHIVYDGPWRMHLTDESLARRRGALDLLGVGLVFSSYALDQSADLRLVTSNPALYVYARKSPWPRAFFASRLKTYDSIDDIVTLAESGIGPFVAVRSDFVAAQASTGTLIGGDAVVLRARDYALTNNATSFTVDATSPGVIYLGESDEPGSFKAYLNGVETPYFSANGAFKAIAVSEAGTYRVKVEFWPRGLSAYLTASAIGLLLLIGVATYLRRRADALS